MSSPYGYCRRGSKITSTPGSAALSSFINRVTTSSTTLAIRTGSQIDPVARSSVIVIFTGSICKISPSVFTTCGRIVSGKSPGRICTAYVAIFSASTRPVRSRISPRGGAITSSITRCPSASVLKSRDDAPPPPTSTATSRALRRPLSSTVKIAAARKRSGRLYI